MISAFTASLASPIFEQLSSVQIALILITENDPMFYRFSTYTPKTFQNILFCDDSRRNSKRSKSCQNLLRKINRIRLLSCCFSAYPEDCCFFSGTNISQKFPHVIRKDLPICLRHFANQIRTGRMTASLASTSEHPALLQSTLPAIDSKTFTDWGSLLLFSRIRTVPLPPDSVKRWAHFHRDGSLGA